jgi:uncharacterized protein YdeI (BOF family)
MFKWQPILSGGMQGVTLCTLRDNLINQLENERYTFRDMVYGTQQITVTLYDHEQNEKLEFEFSR